MPLGIASNGAQMTNYSCTLIVLVNVDVCGDKQVKDTKLGNMTGGVHTLDVGAITSNSRIEPVVFNFRRASNAQNNAQDVLQAEVVPYIGTERNVAFLT
ncbi:hypothetical protein ElyMa_005420200 [Elysia marginata]|uniref:Uncharacterized protein n=1 Tax=Elysia marginata TaxID=1093978 RepID=A0AAV4EKM4_9GAST|nr:hypothetical protein ElyMa_005420200 [Elysia marginata]